LGNETLDTYDEGTWTPTLGGSTTNPTVTYAVQQGIYTRIGNLVTVRWSVGTSANTGGVGYILIKGLPFTQNAGASYRTIAPIMGYGLDVASTTYQLAATGNADKTYFYLLESRDATSWVNSSWTQATGVAVYFNGVAQFWV
jgi:hypothetical protein